MSLTTPDNAADAAENKAKGAEQGADQSTSAQEQPEGDNAQTAAGEGECASQAMEGLLKQAQSQQSNVTGSETESESLNKSTGESKSAAQDLSEEGQAAPLPPVNDLDESQEDLPGQKTILDSCSAIAHDSSTRTTHSSTPTWELTGGPGEGTHETLPTGTIIADRYEVMSFLGEGGMSSVYQVWQILMKRDAALKMLHPQSLQGSRGAVARFQREAQALASLDHPNIVKIHDFGTDREGRPYLVMDLVPGKSLAHIIKHGGAMSPEKIVEIFAQACDALEHAHQKGIVHRDLKPSNVMLVDDKVKILDFGIAKILDRDGADTLHLTRTGEMCGSPLYMSPEQCKSAKLDARSDIYSMGCLIFQAFTGVPPLQAGSLYETLYLHMNEVPKSIGTYRFDLKTVAEIDALILKCMAKKPEDRFQSMLELKAALLRLGSQRHKKFFDSMHDQLELNRLKLGAGAGSHWRPAFVQMVVIVAVVLLLVAAWVATASLVEENRRATASETSRWKDISVAGQQAFDNGNYKEAQSRFAQMQDLAKDLRQNDLILAGWQHMLDLENARKLMNPLSKEDKGDGERIATLENQVQQAQKQEETTGIALAKELKSARAKNSGHNSQLCKQAAETALSLASLHHCALAIELLNNSLELAKTNVDNDAKEVLGQTLFMLGRSYLLQNDNKTAGHYYKLALEQQQKTLKRFDPDLARTMIQLANVEKNDPALKNEVGALLNEALQIDTRSLNPDNPRVALPLYYLALFHQTTGDLTAAQKELDRCINLCRQPRASTDVDNDGADTQEILIRALKHRSDNALAQLDVEKLTPEERRQHQQNAVKDIDEGLALAEAYRTQPYINADLAELLCNKAVCFEHDAAGYLLHNNLIAMSDGSEYHTALMQAKARFVRALTLCLHQPEDKNAMARQAALYDRIGTLDRKMSNLPAAQKMFEKAVQTSTRAFGQSAPQTMQYQKGLENCYRDAGITANSK